MTTTGLDSVACRDGVFFLGFGFEQKSGSGERPGGGERLCGFRALVYETTGYSRFWVLAMRCRATALVNVILTLRFTNLLGFISLGRQG